MFVIFERLNTGGVALNDMEIRNCLFRGQLNSLLRTLASTPEFIQAINQNNFDKRMTDRSFILRFLAFYERHYTKCRQGLKQFLNEFFETYRNPGEPKLAEYEKAFKKSMKACLTIFGDHAFRVRRNDEKGGGEWGPRANAAIFQVLSVSFAGAKYDLSQLTRAADAIFEEYLDLISSDAEWVASVTTSTGDAPRIEYAFKTWQDRLDALMAGFPPNDSQRAFSRALKQELYNQSRTCAICNQEVRVLNDAALDHDLHYWRGGRTIPSNARLVHRHCNLTRPR